MKPGPGRFTMKTFLGWHNLIHRKSRSLSALAGVAMVILLIFLQVGFYKAASRAASRLIAQFSHDVVILSPQYVYIADPGSIDRERVVQALAVDGVQRAVPYYHGVAMWRNVSSGVKREVVVMGFHPHASPFNSEQLNELLSTTTQLDAAVADRKTGLGYEEFKSGTCSELNGRRVNVVADYTHGAGFIGNAALLVNELTFSRIFHNASLEEPTIGLVWVEAGENPARVVAELRAILPDDVRVVTRAEHLAMDRNFIMRKKPVGIIFSTGLGLAFIVGAVILYQILSAEVASNLSEYATLKAIGCSRVRVYAVVWQQAVLFAAFGYVPALLVSLGVYAVIDATTALPTKMTLGTIVIVFVISAVMGCLAGFLAVRKIERADPADLF